MVRNKDVFIATDRNVEHLPWIYEGRVWKYWEKIMPTNYPDSSSTFSLSFDSEESRAAVEELEDTVADPEGVIAQNMPANSFLRDYVGTYNVEGTPGELTLLSPEKVNTDSVVALHYVEAAEDSEENQDAPGTWEVVEDAQVIDGYVWGTLESFSPIAIFTYAPDMEVYSSGLVIPNGNPVLFTQEDEDVYVTNQNTGAKVKVPGRLLVIGGTYWEGDCASTSITFKGIKKTDAGIFAGSYINPESEVSAKLGDVKVTVVDSEISFVTGPCGAVKTESLKYNFKNSIIKDYIGSGESIIGGKDAGTKDPDSTNKYANHVVSYELDGVECDLVYAGGNCGYTWTGKCNIVAKNSKFGYYIAGGSNGTTENCYIEAEDCEIVTFQTNNRGIVGTVEGKFKGGNKVENFFLLGDANDSTVNGTTAKVKVDIDKGAGSNYNIAIGTQAGVAADQEVVDAVIDTVKISRGANFEISDADSKLLGDKLIIK